MSSVVVVGTALCEHRRTNRSTARQTPGPSCLPAPESTRLSGGGGSGGLCSHPRDLNGTSASSRCSVALESSDSAEWAQLSRGERRLMVCTVCPGHPKPAPARVRRPQRLGARRPTAVPQVPLASGELLWMVWYADCAGVAQSLAASNSGGQTGCWPSARRAPSTNAHHLDFHNSCAFVPKVRMAPFGGRGQTFRNAAVPTHF